MKLSFPATRVLVMLGHVLIASCAAAAAQTSPSPTSPAAPASPAAPPPPDTPALAVPGPGTYVVRPARLSRPPALDGKLEDPVWREAAHISGFRQLEPREGAPASEATDVYLGYDTENLYIGARCHDSQPDKVVANIRTRDGDLSYDDTLLVVLDTYRDGRSGFLFATNPLGAEIDALVRNEGEEVNYDWDGIWRCMTSRDAGGWTVEMAIPFRTLRFPAGQAQSWGFNVLRYIPRKYERSFWTPMLHAYGFFAPYAISRYGEMAGLEGIEQGRRYDFKPYLRLGARRDQGKPWKRDVNGGFDFRLNLGHDLVGDLTYRTDFAETEADEQVVNLTRFNLYLPEKREFFLEGANLFYFGERPEPQRAAETIMFFSRQIGLTPDGLQQVPVIGGAKLTGHQGPYSIGALSIATQALHLVDAFGNVERQPETVYSVLRVKRDFGKSTFGLLGMSKEAAGDHNRLGGADWDLGLTDALRTGGYLVRSSTRGAAPPRGETWAGSGDLYWNSRNTRFRFAYTQIGDGFNDEVGFITRTGVRQWRWDSNLILWPENILHQTWFTYDLDYITNLQNQLVSRVNSVQANTFFRDSSGVALKWYDNLEVLPAPFAIHPGVVIKPGPYQFRYTFFGFQTDYSKPLGGAGRLSWGDFYDGTQLRTFYAVVYRPLPGLFTALTYEHDRVELKAGKFTTDLLLAELTYGFTPTIAARFWLNWDRLNNLRAKLVFKWEYRPGAQAYLVYQDIRKYADIFDPQQPLAGITGKQVLLKTVFRF